jgi:beta-galactosidase
MVRLRQGRTPSGAHLRYYLNYSSEEQPFAYTHGAGTDILTGSAIARGQTVTLEPWGLAIIEER